MIDSICVSFLRNLYCEGKLHVAVRVKLAQFVQACFEVDPGELWTTIVVRKKKRGEFSLPPFLPSLSALSALPSSASFFHPSFFRPPPSPSLLSPSISSPFTPSPHLLSFSLFSISLPFLSPSISSPSTPLTSSLPPSLHPRDH